MGRALAVIIWILTLGSVSLFFVKKWWFPNRHFFARSRP